MIWCDKYKINVNTGFDCKDCSFWKTILGIKKCIYPTWYPGLKLGKDLSKKEE